MEALPAPSLIDPDRLMDLVHFDPSGPCRFAVETAAARQRAHHAIGRGATTAVFEAKRAQLEERIREARDGASAERERHIAIVDELGAQIAALRLSNNSPHTGFGSAGNFRGEQRRRSPPAASSFAPSREGDYSSLVLSDMRSMSKGRATSSLGGRATPSAASRASPSLGCHSSPFAGRASPSRGGRSSPSADGRGLKPRLGKGGASAGAQAVAAPAPVEAPVVKQWGALLVGWLGLAPFPTKPRSWKSCVTSSRGLAPPRVARSYEEALDYSVASASFEALGGGSSEFTAGPSYLLASSRQLPGSLSID